MIPLSSPPTPNERALASVTRERITGIVGVTLTLDKPPVDGLELLFKNGTLLDPDSYTVSEATITLPGAAIVGDVFVAHYHARR